MRGPGRGRARRRPRRSRANKRPLRRRTIVVLALLAVAFLAASVRLFVVPARDAPAKADAIVVFGGGDGRLDLGVRLAREGLAPVLAVSAADQAGCRAAVPPDVEIVCFRPEPLTTQGEARGLARLAAERDWQHVIAVVSRAQTTRARIRVQRCTDLRVDYVTATPSLALWPYRIAYEWAALVKAEILQRRC